MLQTIGILGVENKVGVTHLAIMLGNYMNAKLHKNTAILEVNQTGAFFELSTNYASSNMKKNDFKSFIISGVTYYYGINIEMIGKVFSRDHDCIIIDFGAKNTRKTEEFLKCNIQLVVGNLNPWNSQRMIQCIEDFVIREQIDKIKYIIQFGSKEEIHQIKNAYEISIFATPFEPDPFLIHGYNFGFLDTLLD